MEMKYNENNLLASECYKGVNGQLVKHSTHGYAKATYAYDSKRNRIEEKYFGTNGRMTNYVTYRYNDHNKLLEACILNPNGKPDDSRLGFSKLRISYSNDGVTPMKKSYYRGGSLFAWQYFDGKTGTWGNLSF